MLRRYRDLIGESFANAKGSSSRQKTGDFAYFCRPRKSLFLIQHVLLFHPLDIKILAEDDGRNCDSLCYRDHLCQGLLRLIASLPTFGTDFDFYLNTNQFSENSCIFSLTEILQTKHMMFEFPVGHEEDDAETHEGFFSFQSNREANESLEYIVGHEECDSGHHLGPQLPS